jgi:hypothetical protein
MGTTYDEKQNDEKTLRQEIAKLRDLLSMGTPVGNVATSLVDLSEDLGRKVGVDLTWVLAKLKAHGVSKKNVAKIRQVVFLARALEKQRANQGRPRAAIV